MKQYEAIYTDVYENDCLMLVASILSNEQLHDSSNRYAMFSLCLVKCKVSKVLP